MGLTTLLSPPPATGAAGQLRGSPITRRSLLRAAPAAALAPWGAQAAANGSVDLMLVLALDASGSLSDERLALQREGHARAVVDPAFLGAVAAGPLGRIAVTAMEWSGADRQGETVPWTVIAGPVEARPFGAALLRAPRPMPGFTSISGAIDYAAELMARAPWGAACKVIDLSANGPGNDGRPAAAARDDAVRAGITVNGLPILDAVPGLEAYFAEQVIGGPRAFLVAARDAGSYAQAILRKLVAEIALGTTGTPAAG